MNRNQIARLNVLVMHNEPLMAVGLVAALRQQADFEVYVHGVDMLAEGPPHIDVVVADYGSGLALVERARSDKSGALARARVMVLTLHDREHDIRLALQGGVHGYLLLGCPLEELGEGVRTLGRGSRYLCRAAAQRMADSLTHEPLTARESDVLTLVARGDCNKSIARDLEITVGTVKAHVKAIMSKLDASCRTEAARIAADRGLVGGRHAESSPLPTRQSQPLRKPARVSAAHGLSAAGAGGAGGAAALQFA